MTLLELVLLTSPISETFTILGLFFQGIRDGFNAAFVGELKNQAETRTAKEMVGMKTRKRLVFLTRTLAVESVARFDPRIEL
jgi:hypothetical protein